MIRISNIIAELCSIIISTCQDDSLFVKYSCLSDGLKQVMLKDISDNIDLLFEAAPENMSELLKIRQLENDVLNDRLYSRLEKYISILQNRDDRYAMIALLQVLDEAMGSLLLEKIRAYQKDDFSVVLNTNREMTGIGLLPRCSCAWERKHRLSHSYNRLDNFLFNFLLMENSILGELIDKHFFLPEGLFPDFSTHRYLMIGATALRAERHFIDEGYIEDDIQYFRISYDREKAEEDNELVWQKLKEAAENNCDIMVFPEMLGNNETIEYISQRLKALTDEQQKKMPSIIILPSVWENKMNTVTVLDRYGNTICRQSKQNPFRKESDTVQGCEAGSATVSAFDRTESDVKLRFIEKKQGGSAQLEGIRTNRVVNILHYEGIGRIAVLICKDFLTTSYMEQLMRCFKLTLIIVPSFSTGSYDFCQSFDLCAHDDCNVIWINTCAAIEKGKEANFKNIGYVRKRIGRNDDDSQKLCEMPVCSGAFCGNCRRDCIYFENIGFLN